MSFGAKSQGVHPNFFRFEMETFYDENARQMLPADVRCYILLSEISKNFRQEVWWYAYLSQNIIQQDL